MADVTEELTPERIAEIRANSGPSDALGDGWEGISTIESEDLDALFGHIKALNARLQTKQAQVFLVGGSAGCYSSSHDWVVAGFTTKVVADQFLSCLQEAIDDYGSAAVENVDRETVMQHFVDLGFPKETIPYGDLDDLCFFVYPVSYIGE